MKYILNLLRFFPTVNPTANTYHATPINISTQNATGADMTDTMKTFYEKTLLENARAQMVFTPLGKKVAMKGNKIEFRKFNTFAKATTPLTEGVIPTGSNFGMTKKEISTNQHGDYVAISDRLQLESFDDVIYGATEEMGAAEGETFDILTRNKIVSGTNVAYAPIGNTAVAARTSITNGAILTPALVNKVSVFFKKNRVPKIDGYWVWIIHPSQAYDLRQSDEWKAFHQYADVDPIYKGEIGTLHGFRFIEDANVKIVAGGASSALVYLSLAMGKDAFAVLDPEGEGMEMIIKDREQIGGPLNQYSTVGYKFCHGADIIYNERIVRVETGATLAGDDSAN